MNHGGLKLKKVRELIRNNPETAFLAVFGLVRGLIGYGALALTIVIVSNHIVTKINDVKDAISDTAVEVISATVGEVAAELSYLKAIPERIDRIVLTIDELPSKANKVKAINLGIKELSPRALKRPEKKIKTVPAPKPAVAKDIPGLAVEGDLQLKEINERRGKLRLPAIQRSRHLVFVSMDRAIDLAEKCTLTHEGRNKKYGENLFLSTQSDDGAVRAWADERHYYSARDGSCRPGKDCSHWTALTWKDTKEAGCATARCGNRSVVTVCTFFPAGNVKGQKAYN
jgi:pathogenesis-related protein 1